MRPLTIRLEEETIEELDREADVFGFSNRSDYLRHIVQNREVPTQEIGTAKEKLELLDEKLDYLINWVELDRLPGEDNAALAYDRYQEQLADDELRDEFEEKIDTRRARAEQFLEAERERGGKFPWEIDEE